MEGEGASARTRRRAANMYQCETCQREFKSKSSLERHSQYHGAPSFVCDLCGKKFYQKDNMNQHRQSHFLSHLCSQCGKLFATKYSLKRHVKIYHEIKGGYLCPICGKMYSSKPNLSGHLVTHGEEKHYSCEKCKQSFGYKASLKRHQVKCTGKVEAGDFECTVCKKTFQKKRYLSQHMKVHDTPTLICSITGKVFRQKSSFRKHLDKLTEMKPK